MQNKSFFKRFSFSLVFALFLILLIAPTVLAQSHHAVEVISYDNLGSGLYGDPNAVLGEPATVIKSDWSPGGSFRVKLVEPAFDTDMDDNPVLTTILTGGHITVKFDGKVHNNPDNPYGIDFIIYSNAFFLGSGFVDDTTNMNDLNITGGGSNFTEKGKVSVSQDGETWYTFDDGPYNKGNLFPTQAFQWDAVNAQWTDQKMDFTKAVNPALTVDDFIGKSAAEAIALYNGAGGGTGFNLNDVGLDWIQYVKVEPALLKTDVDAFAAVSFLEEDPDDAITIDLRATDLTGDIFNVTNIEIPAGNITASGFELDKHTAMGALAYYCQQNNVNLVITDTDFGLYLWQIGDDPANENSWMYAVNGDSPWVGASEYEIESGDSLHFHHWQWDPGPGPDPDPDPDPGVPGDTILQGNIEGLFTLTAPGDIMNWALSVGDNTANGTLNVKSNQPWQAKVEDANSHNMGYMSKWFNDVFDWNSALKRPLMVEQGNTSMDLTTGGGIIATGEVSEQPEDNSGQNFDLEFKQEVLIADPVLTEGFYRIVLKFIGEVLI